jgi:hypothetical protein
VLITAYGKQEPDLNYLEPQSYGLLATLWFSVSEEASPQTIDIDSSFVEPAGEFIFSAAYGGSIKPDYIDCGTEDIILQEPCMCGDANGDGIWNISDALCIIYHIFPPNYCEIDPLCLGDADGNELVNISDAVFLIAYIFGGGPEPHCP